MGVSFSGIGSGEDARPRFPFVRWTIIGLFVLAMVLNYLARSVLGVSAPMILGEQSISSEQYSWITSAFQLGVMFQPLVGYFLDGVGLRLGFTVCVALWSLITIAHVAAQGWAPFAGLRFALGLAEGSAQPAGQKLTAEWFPARERGLASGVYNIGASFGAVFAPLLVACAAFMASFYGVYGYVGDHLHRGLGLPVSAGGLLALCYGLGFGATTFLDRWIDRLGPARLLPLFFAVVGGVYLAMTVASSSYPALLAVVFCWGMANHAALNVLILRLAALDPGRRGAIMGLNSGVTYLALFAGTSGFGPLYASAGFAALAGLAVALMLVAALAAALAPRAVIPGQAAGLSPEPRTDAGS